MLPLLKGSSKYQVKAEVSDVKHFKHRLWTVCTYVGENHPKELRFQLDLKLLYLRIWWPETLSTMGTVTEGIWGRFFLFKITFSRFSQNCLVVHPFEHVCS